jgi:hypothetical protein
MRTNFVQCQCTRTNIRAPQISEPLEHQSLMITGRRAIKHISGLDGVSTPQVFYTYFCNHARRLRLEKLQYCAVYCIIIPSAFSKFQRAF